MDERKRIPEKFFRLTSATFTCVIIANALPGWILGSDEGMQIQFIFQILLLAAVNSGISVFVTNAKIFARLLTLWQLIITMFSCLTATILLAIPFRMIPLHSPAAWAAFIAIFVATFIVVSAVVIIKTKLDENRYNRQLSNYKENQKHD